MNSSRTGWLLVGTTVVALGIGGTLVLGQEDDAVQPVDFTHNIFDAPAPVPSAVFGTGPALKRGQQICTTAFSAAANVNTDCESTSVGPHNETSIAVNPTNPLNMIGGL